MRRDGIEVAKGRMKFKCPKISHAGGCISCTCENPCSNAKIRTYRPSGSEKIIQDCLMIHQEAVRNGNGNTMQELLLSVLTNARN